MFKRDAILRPFAGYEEIPYPHKVAKGVVKVYRTELDNTGAVNFFGQHGYKLWAESKGAIGYSKSVGRFKVNAVYNKNDKTVMVGIERA